MKTNSNLLPLLALCLGISGCQKEKTITSTEYVHDIQYVEGPTDTMLVIDTLNRTDTVYHYDSVIVESNDTLILVDTVISIEYVYDTTYAMDTVTITQFVHDTVQIIDTVLRTECPPYVHFAFTSLTHYLDPLVIDFINAEFGLTDGWVFYLSLSQSDVSSPATGIYDFYGYIDYWTPDWSGYYALEYNFRMTHLGGDPSDPDNWALSEPPSPSPLRKPGLGLAAERAETKLSD